MQDLGACVQMAVQVFEQILAANGRARLPRCPRGERAPVGVLSRARGHGRREARVTLGDLQVPNHPTWDGDYALYFPDVGCVCGRDNTRHRSLRIQKVTRQTLRRVADRSGSRVSAEVSRLAMHHGNPDVNWSIRLHREADPIPERKLEVGTADRGQDTALAAAETGESGTKPIGNPTVRGTLPPAP